jgi:flagellar biosynthesis chaperone FliJ
MSEEPINPYYMYDNATLEYLQENLLKKVKEASMYKKWYDRASEEIRYIEKKLEEKQDG